MLLQSHYFPGFAGIYALDADRLRLAWYERAKRDERPPGFDGDKDPRLVVYTFKRQAAKAGKDE